MKHPKSLIFALLTFVLLAACSPNQNEPIVKTTNDLNTLELIGRVKLMTQHTGVNSTGKIYTLFNEQGNIMERGSYRSYDIFNSKAPFEKQVKEILNISTINVGICYQKKYIDHILQVMHQKGAQKCLTKSILCNQSRL